MLGETVSRVESQSGRMLGNMTGNESTTRKRISKHFGTSEVLLVLIFAVSGAGVALTDMSPSWGRWFWLGMVPLLAGTSLHEGWVRAKARGDSGWRILRKQIFHWVGLLGALEVVFVLYATNRIDAPQAGLFCLLSVALASFLAGIHFHWHLGVLGVLLAGSAVLVAWVEASVWMVIPLSLAVVAVVIYLSHRASRIRST